MPTLNAPNRSVALRAGTAILSVILFSASAAMAQRWHDDEIRKVIIDDSIVRYGGDCPCPYSYAWNGKQCANDSAYMKRVPNAPYCYPQDVPPYLVYQYRRERGL